MMILFEEEFVLGEAAHHLVLLVLGNGFGPLFVLELSMQVDDLVVATLRNFLHFSECQRIERRRIELLSGVDSSAACSLVVYTGGHLAHVQANHKLLELWPCLVSLLQVVFDRHEVLVPQTLQLRNIFLTAFKILVYLNIRFLFRLKNLPALINKARVEGAQSAKRVDFLHKFTVEFPFEAMLVLLGDNLRYHWAEFFFAVVRVAIWEDGSRCRWDGLTRWWRPHRAFGHLTTLNAPVTLDALVRSETGRAHFGGLPWVVRRLVLHDRLHFLVNFAHVELQRGSPRILWLVIDFLVLSTREIDCSLRWIGKRKDTIILWTLLSRLHVVLFQFYSLILDPSHRVVDLYICGVIATERLLLVVLSVPVRLVSGITFARLEQGWWDRLLVDVLAVAQCLFILQ